jgi:2-phospho-L-lactate guanylyltransferase (CobY/MobA/RfbA family)
MVFVTADSALQRQLADNRQTGHNPKTLNGRVADNLPEPANKRRILISMSELPCYRHSRIDTIGSSTLAEFRY